MASRLMSVVRRQIVGTRNYSSSSPFQTIHEASQEHGGGVRTWKILSFCVAFPGVLLCYINAHIKEAEHKAHGTRPEFVKYDHLRIRTKRFPWGDGNHSLFHTEANALPDGYED